MRRFVHHAMLAALTSVFASACIVVPAQTSTVPPPPPPPPDNSAAYNNPPPPPPPTYATPAPVYQDPNVPPPQGYSNDPTYGQATYDNGTTATVVVYWEDPPPQPVAYYEPSVVWYYGPHPVTPGYGYGWCPIAGAHTHNYDPAWNDRYEFWQGYYFYVGDPYAYDPSVYYYVYVGPHPNPWGGWCYAQGEHRHYYGPRRGENYRHEHDRWEYAGAYDNYYYQHQREYDQSGHRRGTTSYHEHVEYRTAHSNPAFARSNPPISHTVIPTRATVGHEAPNNGVHGNPPQNGHLETGTAPAELHGGNPHDVGNPHEPANGGRETGNPHEIGNPQIGNPHEIRPEPTPKQEPAFGFHPAATPAPTPAPVQHGNPHFMPAPTPAPAEHGGARVEPVHSGAIETKPTPKPEEKHANPHAVERPGLVKPTPTPAPANPHAKHH